MKSRTDNRQRADLVEATAGPRGGGGGGAACSSADTRGHLTLTWPGSGRDRTGASRDGTGCHSPVG